jgi:multidrug efflux pump subunit AcrB
MQTTRTAIDHPVFATMVMVALCVLGLFSYQRLGVEQMPDTSAPVVSIDVRYPGASPLAVESEIAKPLEDALNGLAGVKTIRSSSYEGDCVTVAEFGLGADMTRATQEVRDRVAAVQAGFNRDVKAPVVTRFEGDNAQPVVVLALMAGDRGARELSLIADQQIRKRLTSIDGVAQVTAVGMATREVRIDLDPQRMRAFGLTPVDVSAALAKFNVDLPVGVVSDAAESTLVRVEGRMVDPRQFSGVVVARDTGGGIVTLADLGRLVEREQEPDSISRVDGRPAITFNVFRQQDANIVATGTAVKDAVDELRLALPTGVELKTLYASSDFVARSIDGVKRTLVEGAVLTAAIVLLFLNSWRSTVITALTLPVSVLASFVAIAAFGFTLNFMTLLALSLCIGLLIDDAIVVRENIVRRVDLGEDHRSAARTGTDEIGLAVTATTFAICAVFVPMAFVKGIVHKFFLPFGVTVVGAVVVSLFVSFTLDPMLSSVWREPRGATLEHTLGIGHAIRGVNRLMAMLHAFYERTITWTFSRRRYRVIVPPIPVFARPFDRRGARRHDARRHWRFATLTPRGCVVWGACATFAGALLVASQIGTETIPQTDQDYTSLWLELPVGSSLARVDEKMKQVEAILREIPEVRSVSAQIGGDNGRNAASFGLGLVPRAQRLRTQFQVEDDVRRLLRRVPGLGISVGGQSVSIAILGPDSTVLDQIASDLAARVRDVRGLVDLQTSVKPGTPTVAVRLKPDAIRELGLNPSDLAANLRAYVQGDAATWWTTPDGEQVQVLLRLPETDRQRVAQLERVPVAFAKDGTAISLSQVATVESVMSPQVIKRQQLQRRQVVYGGVDAKSGRTVGAINADIHRAMSAMVLPPGYRFDVGGAAKDEDEIRGNVGSMLGLALVFLYIVLASQFGSFLQPIAIMASLPLSLIGATVSLKLWGSSFNLFSLIGLVMLMGLVTKNAILLVDFANRARRDGARLVDALLGAGQIRMRPIVMTTAAMAFGMLPLALALGDGGELQAPMGRAIIGGLVSSTLLTLLVVPVLYSYVEQWRRFFTRDVDGRARGAAAAATLASVATLALLACGMPAAAALAAAIAACTGTLACLWQATYRGRSPAWCLLGVLGAAGFLFLAFLLPARSTRLGARDGRAARTRDATVDPAVVP